MGILSFRADPLSNMVLTFSTKEDAIAFAEKNGKILFFLNQDKIFVFLTLKPFKNLILGQILSWSVALHQARVCSLTPT